MPLGEQEFQTFIERLDAEAGMRRKLRLLAGSRSQLRQLSAGQRQRLAVAIGNRWAWRNIESLFGNPRQLSDNQREVKEFFESMREAEPEELLEIGQEIKRGEFAGAKGLVLEAVGEALDGDPEPEEVEESVEAIEVAPATREVPPTVPQVVPVPVIDVPAEEPATIPDPTPAKAVVEEEVHRETEPKSVAPRPVTKPAPMEERPRLPLRTDTSGLSAAGLMRLMRRLSAGELSSSRSDRAAMVAGLSSGWAARRAVSAMIRSHSASDLEEALALIRRLPTAAQQAWCLGDLVEHWDLDDAARRRVLAAAPTGAAKRRLASRTSRAERLASSRDLH